MKNKRSLEIELIHPPHPEATEDRLDAPLGLLYMASNLKKHDYNVRINDLSGVPADEWKIGMADIYGITMYAPTINLVKDIAIKCKEINPESTVVTGGAHPTALPREVNSVFDVIVIGEGEEALINMLKEYPNNKRYYQTPLNRNLDLYPDASYHLVDLKSYKRTINDEQAITMLTSRGCPFRCTFCGLPDHCKTVKQRSPERIVSEIKTIQEKYGINKIVFQDDTFTVNKKRLTKMLKMFEPLNIGFKAHGRVGLDTREDYFNLKKAGCEIISWGIETGSQKLLDLMNKNVTVEQNENSIKWAKEAGIDTRAFFLLGFPGETKETIEETKRFIERTDPDQFFINGFVPFPDTDVWLHPEKYGVKKINKDFTKYYLISGDGFGSRTIETDDLTTEEFLEIDREFRVWMNERGRRGSMLEYEKKLEKKAKK